MCVYAYIYIYIYRHRHRHRHRHRCAYSSQAPLHLYIASHAAVHTDGTTHGALQICLKPPKHKFKAHLYFF